MVVEAEDGMISIALGGDNNVFESTTKKATKGAKKVVVVSSCSEVVGLVFCPGMDDGV